MAEPTPAYIYSIRVEGSLSPEWQDWFGVMEIIPANGETRLQGMLPDLAAVYGVLNHLYGLNLALISVEREPLDGEKNAQKKTLKVSELPYGSAKRDL